jgi:putative two-component system response regulator
MISTMTPPAATGSPAVAAVRRLLVVDDEPSIRSAVARFFKLSGYEVHEAGSGRAALRLLEQTHFLAMICDVRMPELSGVETLPLALRIDPDLAVVMVSAVDEAQTAATALSNGAIGYLTKPVDFAELEKAIERALRKRDLGIERRRVEHMIREEVALRTVELEAEKAALHGLTVQIAETLINAMEAKDIYLRGHSQRVAELGASISTALGLDDDTIEHVRLAGRLHDVGKIGIREDVLNKPGKLTPEEYGHIKDHVRIGMEILAPLRHLGIVLDYVHDHHERWDGSGYPRGRSGEEITMGGRILAAADAFDALTSRRAYREPMTPRQAIALLGHEDGRHLDPEVFEALKRVTVGRRSMLLPFIDE